MDAGTDYQGTGPAAKPGGYAKHVVLRVDRADGFVGRNFLVRGAREHAFYNEEVDGILLDRVKFFWGADYGHLSFTSDHNLVKNCDGFGSGDSVVYPGAAPETGSQATRTSIRTRLGPTRSSRSATCTAPPWATRARWATPFASPATTSTATPRGSRATPCRPPAIPGFPADSSEIDHNYIYANNLDLYRPDTPVDPLVGVPIGTGIIYPGMNDARVHDNYIFDNWRDGAMLFAVPDAATNGGGAEGDIFPGVSCPGAPANGLSTSCGNQFFRNRVGRAPNGFRYPDAIDMFGNVHAHDDAKPKKPNGNDFWWSEFFAQNTGNCWYGNTGYDGTAASVTGPGQAGRLPANSAPGAAVELRHERRQQRHPPSSSTCSTARTVPMRTPGPADCDWWTLPSKPGQAKAHGSLLSGAAQPGSRSRPRSTR